MPAKQIQKYQFFKQLTKLSFVEEIWLYGSRARGDHQDRSDVDLAIICPQATDHDWRKILQIIREADTLLKIDCIHFDPLPGDSALRKNILKNHTILFKRGHSMQEKLNQKFEFLGKALTRLKEMLDEPVDKKRSQIDSSIQRFEFSFELFWKTLKLILESKGQKVPFPRDVLKAAYQGGLIDQEEVWLDMLDDRNETSHAYDEKAADKIYASIKSTYFLMLADRFHFLKQRYSGGSP